MRILVFKKSFTFINLLTVFYILMLHILIAIVIKKRVNVMYYSVFWEKKNIYLFNIKGMLFDHSIQYNARISIFRILFVLIKIFLYNKFVILKNLQQNM